MIILSANTTNDVYLTLNEKNTSTGTTNYLFSLTHSETKANKLFYAGDISTSCRYNKFGITISATTEQLTNTGSTAVIDLSTLGNYYYNVYCTTGNTLSTNGLNILEQGMMHLTGTTSSISLLNNTEVVYQYTGQTQNNIIIYE